jgi:hypothetical protein
MKISHKIIASTYPTQIDDFNTKEELINLFYNGRFFDITWEEETVFRRESIINSYILKLS